MGSTDVHLPIFYRNLQDLQIDKDNFSLHKGHEGNHVGTYFRRSLNKIV